MNIYTVVALWWGILAVRNGNKVRHRAMMCRCYMGLLQFLLYRLIWVGFGTKVLIHRHNLLDKNLDNGILEEWVSTGDQATNLGNILFYPSLILLEYVMWCTPFKKVVQGQ